jgi:mannose-6-phosphate isomerase
MRPYPLRFRPLLKERVWGGTALRRFGHDVPADRSIGESWELADLPDHVDHGRSVADNGPLSGRTLHEIMVAFPDMIMGDAPPWPDGRFPLLFKILDARENLSVQVHPDERYAAAHPGAHLKSEAWFVIDADPGAQLYIGLKPGVDRRAFQAAIDSASVESCLVSRPALPGTCHFLPGGTCHALGAGVLVAEMQTPSDTTFRVWDWGRTGRTLHVEEAMACIAFGDMPPQPGPHQRPLPSELGTMTLLTDTPYFSTMLLETSGDVQTPIVLNRIPAIWFCLEGSGSVIGGGVSVPFQAGTTMLFPAAMTDAHASLRGACRMLEIRLPHPAKDALA